MGISQPSLYDAKGCTRHRQRRSQDFFWGGGHPVHFPSSLRGAARIQCGGGVVAKNFRDLVYRISEFSGGGGVVAEIFRDLVYRIRFSGGGGGG